MKISPSSTPLLPASSRVVCLPRPLFLPSISGSPFLSLWERGNTEDGCQVPIFPSRPTDRRARGRRLFYGEKIRHVSPLPPVHAVPVVRVKQRRGGADGDLLSISLVQIIHLPGSSPTAEDLPFSDRTGGGGLGWGDGCLKLARIASGAILCGRNFDPCRDMRTRQLEAREKSWQNRLLVGPG